MLLRMKHYAGIEMRFQQESMAKPLFMKSLHKQRYRLSTLNIHYLM